MIRRHLSVLRILAWEARFLRRPRDLPYAARKIADAAARDVAWLLPRRVALWAFVRVCAEPGVHPDQVTYASAHDAWVSK